MRPISEDDQEDYKQQGGAAVNNPMHCRCNTARHDPDCYIDHTLSVIEADMAFPHRAMRGGPDAPEPCEECDGKRYVIVTTGPCPDCDFDTEPCSRCLGTGVQP